MFSPYKKFVKFLYLENGFINTPRVRASLQDLKRQNYFVCFKEIYIFFNTIIILFKLEAAPRVTGHHGHYNNTLYIFHWLWVGKQQECRNWSKLLKLLTSSLNRKKASCRLGELTGREMKWVKGCFCREEATITSSLNKER